LIIFHTFGGNVTEIKKPPKSTKSSTLFLIIDNQPISLELNQDDLNDLNKGNKIAKNVQINGENVTITIKKAKNGQYTVTRGGTEIPSFQLTNEQIKDLNIGKTLSIEINGKTIQIFKLTNSYFINVNGKYYKFSLKEKRLGFRKGVRQVFTKIPSGEFIEK